MGNRIFGILSAGFLALLTSAWWFYDNLLFDAAIQWLAIHHVPEARLIASLPPFCVTAFIAWGMYALLKRAMESKYGAPRLPDQHISEAIDYIVNDSIVSVRKPPRPEIAEFGPAQGRVMTYVGVEHSDALLKLEERIRRGDIPVSGKRQRNFGHFEMVQSPIPASYWDGNALHPLMCFSFTDSYAQTLSRGAGGGIEQYTSLLVSRVSVEACFAPRSWFSRAWRKLRGVPRVIYP